MNFGAMTNAIVIEELRALALKPPRNRAALLKLTRRAASVNDVVPWQNMKKGGSFDGISLNDVGKILPGARKPPIPKDKSDQRKGGEVGQA